jgi:hypothetical protein
MRRKPSIAGSHDAHAARVAWWASFFATVALISILGLARSAQALTVPDVVEVGPGAAAPAFGPEDDEGDDGEAEAEASEGEELEGEECEAADAAEEVECEDEGDAEAPQECLLSTAEATISASHDRVRLLVRYTSTSPTEVVLDYGLHGPRGSLYLGGEKKHVATRGVLRLTQHLNEDQMEKVMAAKNFTVRLRVADAPDYCRPFFDRQLDVRRATPTGLAWSQAE